MEKINYLLPEESAEMTLNQVKSLRQIEGRLRKLFGLKNYQEVMPPSFEYTQLYTALESNGKTFNQEKMFQFINHEGQSITLRYDFTLPLVRLYSQIKDSTSARYSYFGKIFRKEKRHKGRSTENYQIGIELFGESADKSELEILSLALQVIEQLGLNKTVFEIGSAKFFQRLQAQLQ